MRIIIALSLLVGLAVTAPAYEKPEWFRAHQAEMRRYEAARQREQAQQDFYQQRRESQQRAIERQQQNNRITNELRRANQLQSDQNFRNAMTVEEIREQTQRLMGTKSKWKY